MKNMKAMKFESDTRGKLNKMIDGTVFDSPLTFVTEFMQNAQRAKAISLDICTKEDVIVFQDDGCGLKKVKDLTTFDFSSWKSTDEGFGIGFWSVLGIPDLEYVKIRSHQFLILVNIQKAKTTLEFEVSDTEDYYNGFRVELKSQFIDTNRNEIISRIREDGERMMFDVFVNGERIPRKDIFSEVNGDYVKRYDNRLFEAVLAVSHRSYNYPTIVYELRDVKKFYNFPFISGVISLKKSAVNLKEPDRKEIVYNSKYTSFEAKVKECIKDLYKNFLQKLCGDVDDNLNKYADALTVYLTTKDYESFLFIDDTVKKDIAVRQIKTFLNISPFSVSDENIVEIASSLSQLSGEKESWVCENSCGLVEIGSFKEVSENNVSEVVSNIEETDRIRIGNHVFKKVEQKENAEETASETDLFEQDNNEYDKHEVVRASTYSGNYEIPIVKKSSRRDGRMTHKEMIRKNRNLLWVELANADSYADSIALAEYYNLKVIKAKNKLFENFLSENGVPHIRDIESAITKDYDISDMAPKTTKEEAFLDILEPVRHHFKLPRHVFKIGNITEKITITLNGRDLKTEKKKNTSHKISVYAVNYGEEIIFDRKATCLKKFHINTYNTKKSIGVNELKCLMYHMNTIAHELAHLLYGTVDNTDTHRHYERMLEKEIIKIYAQ